MKRIALLFALAATLTAAQTPTTPAPKTAATAAKPAVKKPGTAAPASAIKLPPGVKPVKGILKTAFSLKYQDFVIGTGALAEPGKLYKVHYTGWLASDGTKFDSSYDHRAPVMDKDNKPVNGPDGKPQLGDPQPLTFPQGRGRLIPGWDQGFEGMKVGGKRRLFIPYQLAYGAMGRPPKIPAKSDLIFDVELVDVTDMPAAPQPGAPRMLPQRPGGAPGAAPGTAPGTAPGSAPGVAPGSTPNPAPGAPATPPAGTSPTAPAPNPAATPNPAAAPSTATPPPATPPATPAPAAKPTNPEQPN
jgi:peptidylprolyl isomerase